MTRKDYELIARAIRDARSETYDDAGQKTIDLVTMHLAGSLKADNSAFQTSKFLEAVEYQTLNVE